MSFNLTLNTRFNPFTYDEMVKPLLQYKQEYDKTQEDYENLLALTEDLNSVVNRGDSPLAAETYGNYSNNLNDIVTDFSKGMTASNRGALLGLRRRFTKEIQPIIKANMRRLELAEEQRKAQLQDPSMIWQNRASDISLDTLVSDPTANYGSGYSGNMLTAEASQIYSALAKEYQDNPESIKQLVGGDFYEYIKRRGFSSEAILAAIANSDKASPILLEIKKQILDKTGISSWGNEEAFNKANAAINSGMWQAIGQDESQVMANWRAQEDLNFRHQSALQAQSQAHAERMAAMNNRRDIVQMVDANGNPLDTYMDLKTGLPTDSKGRIIMSEDGKLNVMEGNNKFNKQANKKAVSETDKQRNSMMKVTSSLKLTKDLGYAPVGIYTYDNNGDLVFSGIGEDNPKQLGLDWFNGSSLSNWAGNIREKSLREEYSGDKFIYLDPGDMNDPEWIPYPELSRKAAGQLLEDLPNRVINTEQDIQLFRIPVFDGVAPSDSTKYAYSLYVR